MLIELHNASMRIIRLGDPPKSIAQLTKILNKISQEVGRESGRAPTAKASGARARITDVEPENVC